jgi:LemA protein
MPYILIGALIALVIIWMISVQRKLVVMDEHVDDAMNQIGVQLSSCFEALIALLNLTKDYAAQESRPLLDAIKLYRNTITAKSTPNDVQKQEDMITEALDRISVIAEQYPELKANKNYLKCMNAIDCYEKMIRTSCLIYNNSAAKINRELRIFPTSVLGGMLGFHQRGYVETLEEKPIYTV